MKQEIKTEAEAPGLVRAGSLNWLSPTVICPEILELDMLAADPVLVRGPAYAVNSYPG